MDQPQQHARMLGLLQMLEDELRHQRLWAGTAPDARALSSVVPFMYDTLQLHEWLQWVFIPRTRAVIDARKNLPGNCTIHPLAEHEFTKLKESDTLRLLGLILDIDNLMNTPPPAFQ
ncbi:MAG: YqcC family protein [bacterium]|nr:YqcC family protein [bacterium]